MRYALQELSQVLFERTGENERVFEPDSPVQLDDLMHLHEELSFVHSVSEDFARRSLH
jgi:hypothetical protein